MKIITLNVHHDADRWEERIKLIADLLLTETPDVIAFQEVALGIEQADRLRIMLNCNLGEPHYFCMVEKQGYPRVNEGLAILTRQKVLKCERLDLGEGGRVAQRVRIEVDGVVVDIVNTHLHHLPADDETVRFNQVTRLLAWMTQWRCGKKRQVLVGDFNATPSSKTILEVKRIFSSAFVSAHGTEPAYTYPVSSKEQVASSDILKTVDYIFYSPSCFIVENVRLIGNQPALLDRSLFPSDHLGLVAEMALVIGEL